MTSYLLAPNNVFPASEILHSIKKILQVIFFSLSTFYLIPSCQKEITDETDDPSDEMAVFTIVKNNDCFSIKVDGVYFDETSLSQSNKVTITVDVSKTGDWTLTSDTLNGFHFSGKGVLSETGHHDIVLEGKGTPTSPGNYKFTVGPLSVTLFLCT